MMIVYEELNEAIASENSGLILRYRQNSEEQNLRIGHRLLIGHQASGKHVLLSNQRYVFKSLKL